MDVKDIWNVVSFDRKNGTVDRLVCPPTRDSRIHTLRVIIHRLPENWARRKTLPESAHSEQPNADVVKTNLEVSKPATALRKPKSQCRNHEDDSSSETSYECPDEQSHSRSHSADTEDDSSSETSYECAECAQKGRLLHTGDTLRYQCDYCRKSFSLKGALSQHMRIHTGERPYRCTHCEARFIQKAHLVQHERIHRNVRPYKCAHCEKTFTQSAGLIQHTERHRLSV